MKLIKELNEQVEFVTEQVDGKKQFFIEGVFLQSEIGNRNKRFYPKDVMEAEVARYRKTFIDDRRAYGELGHPDGPTINPDRISHRIVKLEQNGNNYDGKAKVVDTPMGNIVRALLEEGGKLGVSSRGLGSLKLNTEGLNVVQNDFMIATAADVVIDPSAPDAFVDGIMENVEWICEAGVWKSREIEEAQKTINAATLINLDEVKLNVFASFLNNL